MLKLRVRSNVSTKINIELKYITRPASWSIEYDFVLTDNNDDSYKLDISGHASIYQNTNEDWNDVDITLTTASVANVVSHTSPYTRGVYFQQEEMEIGTAGVARSFSANMYSKQSKSMPEADMTSNAVQLNSMAEASSFGSLNAAYRFHINNPMNISSSNNNINIRGNTNNVYNNANGYNNANNGYNNANGYNAYGENNANGYNSFVQSQSQRISPTKNRVMIKHLSVTGTHMLQLLLHYFNFHSLHLAKTYVWCVPSHHNGAFVRLRASYPHTSNIPLINSNNVRLFIHGIFSGISSTPDVYPGDPLKLDLFVHKGIHVNHVDILRQGGNYEEKTTSWISSDKRKYLTQTEEWLLSVRSSNPQRQLVIMTESIPKSTDSSIQLEIISPQKTVVLDWYDDERYIGELVDKTFLGSSKSSDDTIIYSKSTGTIFFMKWLAYNEEYKINLKFKYTWPDGKKIVIY